MCTLRANTVLFICSLSSTSSTTRRLTHLSIAHAGADCWQRFTQLNTHRHSWYTRAPGLNSHLSTWRLLSHLIHRKIGTSHIVTLDS